MSARSLLLCALALLLSACMAGEDLANRAADDQGAIGELINEGESSLRVLPNSMRVLRVRFLDSGGAPVPGAQVEFAFLGLSGSSFLPTALPVTDGEGRASTTLNVGSSPPASFQVRVSAQGAEPLFIDVKLDSTSLVLLSVETRYTGMRKIASRQVSKIADRTCVEALEANVAGEGSITYTDEDYRPRFELGAGVSYAVLAWGRDSTNAKITVGCTEYYAPFTNDEDAAHGSVEVDMADIPMTPAAKPYKFTMDLDVSVPVARLVEAMRARADAQFPLGAGDTAQGSYYVSALQAELSARGETALADALGESARRAQLTRPIEDALRQADQGLVAYVHGIADRVSQLGGVLKLDVVYGIGVAEDVPMSITLGMVRARNVDATETLLLDKASDFVAPLASIEAVYADTLGAMDIKTLSIDQPLGGYGKALISALAMIEGDALAEVAGCEHVAEVIEGDDALTDACDDNCALSACERALASLRTTVGMDLLSFDVSHPNIGLRGVLYAHDRYLDDGLIDDLGPAELTGNWGIADASDSITGSVPEPPPEIMR